MSFQNRGGGESVIDSEDYLLRDENGKPLEITKFEDKYGIYYIYSISDGGSWIVKDKNKLPKAEYTNP